MVERVNGVLLTPEDCLAIDAILLRGLVGARYRDGVLPSRAEAIAAQVHAEAVEFRNKVLVTPAFKAAPGTKGDSSGSALRSSEATERLSVRQVAQLSGVSEEYIRRLAGQRVLNGARSGPGGAWLLDGSSVAAWIAARKRDDRAA